GRIVPLADVAVLRLDGLATLGLVGTKVARFEALRRENVGGGVNRLPAEGADPSFIQHGSDAFQLSGGPFALGGFQLSAAGNRIGIVDLRDHLMQTMAILIR